MRATPILLRFLAAAAVLGLATFGLVAAGSAPTGSAAPAPPHVAAVWPTVPAAAPVPIGAYTLIVLPDTQVYSAGFPDIFMAQTQWIARNKAALAVVFVSHVGDLTDNGAKDEQWANAVKAMDVLNGVVPYGTCPGNHDTKDITKAEDFSPYVAHFGPARYKDQAWAKPWYGGASADGINSYQKFQAGGRTFLAIHLAYRLPAEAVAFAEEVLKANPGLPTMLTTHFYQNPAAKREAFAEKVWDSLIATHPQIFLVLCGHLHGESCLESKNLAGLPVIQVLADYQQDERGGDGFLRVMTFDEKAKRIRVQTYSPYLDAYKTGPKSRFEIEVDLAERFKAGAAAAVSPPAPEPASKS